MREIVLAAMVTNLKLKPGDDLIVFTEMRAFKGKLMRVHKFNVGLSLSVAMSIGNEDAVYDVEIDTESIVSLAKELNESFQVVPDSRINDDLKQQLKDDTTTQNKES